MTEPVRFSMPIKKARPGGARLIEAFSPKLGRRVSFYSRQAFELWLDLESDPAVHSFCERPTVMVVPDSRAATCRCLSTMWLHGAVPPECPVAGKAIQVLGMPSSLWNELHDVFSSSCHADEAYHSDYCSAYLTLSFLTGSE